MSDKIRWRELNFLNGIWQARAECAGLESQVTALRERRARLSDVLDGDGNAGLIPELEDRIRDLEEHHRAWCVLEREVGTVIGQIEDPVCRAVLSLRYISLLRWSEIQDRMEQQGLYYSQRQIFNLHNQGLEAVGVILASKENDCIELQ